MVGLQFDGSRRPNNRSFRMPAKFSMPKLSEWQLFGNQIEFMTASLRPLPAGRRNLSVFTDKASSDQVDCPVFGRHKLTLNYLAPANRCRS